MRVDAVEKALGIAVSTIVVVAALAFHRGVGDGFDLVKGTLLWIGSAAILPALLSLRNLTRARIYWVAVVFFSAALVMSVVFAVRPLQAVFGQYQRNTGFLTLIACLILFIATSHSGLRVSTAVARTFLVAAFVAGLYAVLQVSGNDPWEWSTPGQDRAVFGTLGNSNTTGGYVGCLLALFAAQAIAVTAWSWKVAISIATVIGAGAVGILGAFQGVVAGVVGLFGVFIFLLFREASLKDAFHGVGLVFLSATALFVVDSASGVLLFCALTLILCGILFTRFDSPISIGKWAVADRRRALASSLVGVLVALVVAFTTSGEVSRQVSEGMRERRHFFGAAIDMFRDSPIFGHGLETFGLYFTRFRSTEHAVNYENNRTSSAHSIPLGMFANGGLILGLAYLLFIGVVAFLLLKNRAKFMDSVLHSGIAISWLATQVQSLVSVEHVALFVQQFVLAGLVVAIAFSGSSIGESEGGRRHRRRSQRLHPGIVVASLLLPILVAVPLSRPLRADVYGLWSLRYAALGQGASSLEAASSARSLAPWSSEQLSRFARASYENGVPDSVTISIDVAKKLDYTPPYGIEVAYRVAEAGRFSEATNLAELALDRDPRSPTLRDSVSDLYFQIGSFSQSQGLLLEARQAFERAISLNPSASFRLAAEDALEDLLN